VPDKPQTVGPYTGLVAAQIFFGTLPVIGKVVLQTVPAVAVVGFRVALTALILVTVQVYRRRIWLQERGDYLRLAVLSLFGITFNQLLFVIGLSMTKASNVSLLAVTIPIFALTVGSIAGFEKLAKRKVFGILLAALGVILIIDPRNASFSSESTVGDILIILNSLSYGIYVATSKSVIMRNGIFRSMMWVFLFASVICVPLGTYSFVNLGLGTVDTTVWLLLIYIAIVATAAPYLLNAYALSHVNPSTVAVFVYLQPLIGFLLAVYFLGEKFDYVFGIATALIFAGVYLVTRRFVPAET